MTVVSTFPVIPLDTTWATTGDLAAWLFVDVATLPAEAPRMLRDASMLVSQHVVAYVPWDTATQRPSWQWQADALRMATCAQVQQWMLVGEDAAVAGYTRDTRVGGRAFQVDGQPLMLCPRAKGILHDAALDNPDSPLYDPQWIGTERVSG